MVRKYSGAGTAVDPRLRMKQDFERFDMSGQGQFFFNNEQVKTLGKLNRAEPLVRINHEMCRAVQALIDVFNFADEKLRAERSPREHPWLRVDRFSGKRKRGR